MQQKYLTESIRERKDDLGWTIERLSQESGVGVRTINRILAGEDVRFSSIESVMNALGLSIMVEKADKEIT